MSFSKFLCEHFQTIYQLKNKNECIIADISGSTNEHYMGNLRVIDKIFDITKTLILRNPDIKYTLYTFDDNYINHGLCIPFEGTVMLPRFTAGSCTHTVRPLDDILLNINKYKPDKIIIITDGQTNSPEEKLQNVIRQLKILNIEIEITSVSTKNDNLELLNLTETNKIPGMDLNNWLGNDINNMSIYNRFHIDIPFTGIFNSQININKPIFMGVEIPKNIIITDFIFQVVELVENKASEINWGNDNEDFKLLLLNIGAYLTKMFITFSRKDNYIYRIADRLSSATSIKDTEYILKCFAHVFTNSRQNKTNNTIINLDETIKTVAEKQQSFQDASNALLEFGTTQGESYTIAFSDNICVINKGYLKPTKKLGSYPNSVDDYGLVHFSTSNHQMFRQAMREYSRVILNNTNPMGPAAIFILLSQMSLMLINGINYESEHMMILREMAVIQTSMDLILEKGKYKTTCYNQWKNSCLPPMHYSRQENHSSLHTNSMINPLKLVQTEWWALMMSMLGLFNEQIENFKDSTGNINFPNNENDFLKYIINKYKHLVKGNYKLLILEPLQYNPITLSEFTGDEPEVYYLDDHANCNRKQWYCVEHIPYIMDKGCIWNCCVNSRYFPSKTEFKRIDIINPQIKLINTIRESKPLYVSLNSTLETLTISETSSSLSNSALETVSARTISSSVDTLLSSKKYVVILYGPPGSGKSTTALKMEQEIIRMGGLCYIVSSDKFNKQGIHHQRFEGIINSELSSFDKKQHPLKVVILDMCNERGFNNTTFRFYFHNYISIEFSPNFNKDKFKLFEFWCLLNVLKRTRFNNNSTYWLDPESAGIETCIKVHNLKCNGIINLYNEKNRNISNFVKIKRDNINQNLTKAQILSLISIGANEYNNFILQQNMDTIIKELFIKL